MVRGMSWYARRKARMDLWLLLSPKLHSKAMATYDLDEVDFVLLPGAPEVNLPAIAPEGVPLEALGEKQVFPKCALVGTGRERREVAKQCVAYSVVAENRFFLLILSSEMGFLVQEGTTLMMKHAARRSTYRSIVLFCMPRSLAAEP